MFKIEWPTGKEDVCESVRLAPQYEGLVMTQDEAHEEFGDRMVTEPTVNIRRVKRGNGETYWPMYRGEK